MNIPTYDELNSILQNQNGFLIEESDENIDPRTKSGIKKTPQALHFLLTAKYKNGRQKTLTKVVINECEFEAYISDKNKRDDVIKDACNLLDKANTGICFK